MSEPLIVQVMVNLLDNALKYSGEGTPIDVNAAVEERRAGRRGRRPRHRFSGG